MKTSGIDYEENIDEIRNGSFFQNMTFGPSGPRLHEILINI